MDRYDISIKRLISIDHIQINRFTGGNKDW